MADHSEQFPFELRLPGHALEIKDPNARATPEEAELSRLVSSLQGAFADAVASFALFHGAVAAESAMPHGEQRQAAYQEEGGSVFNDVDYERKQRVVRERWLNGLMPRYFTRRIIFIQAKSFLFAADNVGRLLSAFGKRPDLPASVQEAGKKYFADLPTLPGVRDTAHHPEDRVRGKVRKKGRDKDIPLQPTTAGGLMSPAGLALVTDNLMNDEYGCTMADGNYGSIAIRASTLALIRDHIQSVLDALEWRGGVDYYPPSSS